MGCHTWFAVKVNRTIEEAREILINSLNKSLSEYINTSKEVKLDYYEFYYESKFGIKLEDEIIEFIDKEFNHHQQLIKRKIRIISKGLCNVAVMRHQPGLSYYFKDKGFFIGSDEFHDCFRLYGYPDIELFSKEETYKFLEDNKDNPKLVLYDYTYKKLEEFWNKYPDGFIHFG